MAEKNNATCSICGRAYHLCLSCKDSMANHPWRVHTDTSEHYKIYQILRGFSTGVYTKGEAKEKLNKVDLHDLEEFRPHIKAAIKDILKEDEIKAAKVEDDVIVENKVSVAENTINVYNATNYKKKNYKAKYKTDEIE